jgi:hypothetical protein
MEHVAGRNDAHKPAVVDHGQSSDLPLQHDLRRFLQGYSRGDCQQVFAHGSVDFRVVQVAAMLAQVTLGDDADELAVLDNGQSSKAA